MASNVFGNPVTDDMVRDVFPNLTTNITTRDRAEVALMLFNAGEKMRNVRRFVHDLKAAYGNNGTSTLGMIYNATGVDLAWSHNQSREGNLVRGITYPPVIRNGQWAGFLHVGVGLTGPSRGVVIYRGTNIEVSSFTLAWDITPLPMDRQNRVHTQIGGPVPSWESIDAAMDLWERNFGHSTHRSIHNHGCYSIVSAGAGSSPEFVGTMTLAGLGGGAQAVATNLFGSPVTDDTVRRVFPNLTTPITDRERAQVALMHMDVRATNVRRFVHDLKQDYDRGNNNNNNNNNEASTLGMIYNATGRDLNFLLNHNWESAGGNAWRTPYPRVIRNGQWVGFLHVRARGDIMGPSKEAIVYRGGFSNDSPLWMLAWNITPGMNNHNRVYTEIFTGSVSNRDWNTVDAAMEILTHSSSSLGYFSTVSTGTGSSPELVGIMSLDVLDSNFMAMASNVSVISDSLDDDDADDNADAPAPAPAPAPAE